MDFKAARRNADERLNQELVRIRNLPKRNKIQVVTDKHGLSRASHTNAGLVKELELNLSMISSELQRFAKEYNKRQKDFRETQKKSLAKFLPPLVKNSQNEPAKGTSRRKPTIFDATPLWVKDRRETVADIKPEMLLTLMARRKQKTLKIISENNKKTSTGSFLPPLYESAEIDQNSWITRLNGRKMNTNRRSCFPVLLEQAERRRERENFTGKNTNTITESKLMSDGSGCNARTFRGVVYQKVLKMPDPKKIPHLNPWDPKLYYVVMKVCDRNDRKMSRLQKADLEFAKRNIVFTRHWEQRRREVRSRPSRK